MTDLPQTPPTYSRSPRVAFYTYPEWAFGAIHSALCKELYKYGVLANIIDWNWQFSDQERADLEKQYDIFVTAPGNAISLLRAIFNVPYEKIIGVAHGRYDLEYGLSQGNDFDKLRKFAGVSPDLKEYSKQLGISRDMLVVRNGIHFDYFYQESARKLATIGYGGAFRYEDFKRTQDIKRGYLAQKVAETLNLPFVPSPKQTYLTMPQYYSQVDAVMVSSCQESCALPLMEAAAAGRLPISTRVGVARDFEYFPGIVLPMEEEGYVAEAVDSLSHLLVNEKEFEAKCRNAQEFAKENYDWSKVIEPWLNLLS
jgi:glycosyltransferase involved in cell wall biosynthesis